MWRVVWPVRLLLGPWREVSHAIPIGNSEGSSSGQCLPTARETVETRGLLEQKCDIWVVLDTTETEWYEVHKWGLLAINRLSTNELLVQETEYLLQTEPTTTIVILSVPFYLFSNIWAGKRLGGHPPHRPLGLFVHKKIILTRMAGIAAVLMPRTKRDSTPFKSFLVWRTIVTCYASAVCISFVFFSQLLVLLQSLSRNQNNHKHFTIYSGHGVIFFCCDPACKNDFCRKWSNNKSIC